MRASAAVVAGVALSMGVDVVVSATDTVTVAHADFEWCTNSSPGTVTYQSRLSAYLYAYPVVGERYGGAGSGTGCWVDDNVANTQEGADCSGFVAKGWFLRSDYWNPVVAPDTGLRYWHPLRLYTVGWSSSVLHDTPSNASWKDQPNPTFMDAAAKNGHVVLIIQATATMTDATVLEETPGVGRQGTKDVSPDKGYLYRERTGWAP